jgi:hypothetical protein
MSPCPLMKNTWGNSFVAIYQQLRGGSFAGLATVKPRALPEIRCPSWMVSERQTAFGLDSGLLLGYESPKMNITKPTEQIEFFRFTVAHIYHSFLREGSYERSDH